MEFKPLSNITAKQVIDATRAYKELVLTRRNMQQLGGSMFWKLSGSYVYLAQRSFFDSRKVEHLGIKSSQTEQKLEDYEAECSKLHQRETALQKRISVHERMNKAVRAGSVSNDVIDAIRVLESVGLSEDCIWLGSPAQHAYWQSSGLETPKHLGADEHLGVHLVFVRRKIEAISLIKLYRCRALKFDAVQGEKSSLLIIKPTTPAQPSVSHDPSAEHALQRYSKFIHDTVRGYIDLILDESQQPPFFEHVLISKTGRMGMLKTVDPTFFMAWSTLFGLEISEKDLFKQLLESGLLARRTGSVSVSVNADHL
ncbi:UNVERIFIED_CONTAM: hypothetical protein NO986_10755 [Comamonas sp. A-3]|uniref:hypothetical protein n=1 Tax=Comamonas testosteroni TaxID=285 RepID=UPI0028D4FC79|nr:MULTISPECIES: hypothetical protein [Comamonas]